MNCPSCGGPMRCYAGDRIAGSDQKCRRRRCKVCGHKTTEIVPVDDLIHPSTWKEGRLSDAQIEWALTTRHSGTHCAAVLGCSKNLIYKIRRRLIYRNVRPDLGRWRLHQPWLTDDMAPPGMTVAAKILQRANRHRNCIECQHFGGLQRICALGHAAVKAAGMKAAVECTDYQELEDDDEPELEAAG